MSEWRSARHTAAEMEAHCTAQVQNQLLGEEDKQARSFSWVGQPAIHGKKKLEPAVYT